MDSRSLDFSAETLELTGGRGVDIVLNSLNGDYIPQSLATLAEGGRFVEIGKIGVWDARQVAEQRPDVAYYPFDLGEEERRRPGLIAELLAELLARFRKGELPALPHKVFAAGDVVGAFRHMQQAKHQGKVVVSLAEREIEDITPRADATYLITGGLGALGLAAAQWLVARAPETYC